MVRASRMNRKLNAGAQEMLGTQPRCFQPLLLLGTENRFPQSKLIMRNDNQSKRCLRGIVFRNQHAGYQQQAKTTALNQSLASISLQLKDGISSSAYHSPLSSVCDDLEPISTCSRAREHL